jgi:hypothetical protein
MLVSTEAMFLTDPATYLAWQAKPLACKIHSNKHAFSNIQQTDAVARIISPTSCYGNNTIQNSVRHLHHTLHYLRSGLIWCKTSSVLVVYSRDCQVLLQIIFTSNTKRNKAKRFEVLASLIPGFLMRHTIMYTHIPSTYLTMEVPSVTKVLFYTECNN